MESKNHNQKLTITAIAGILFFSHFIRKTPLYLNETTENKDFLDHYLKIGEINLIILIGCLFFRGINFFLKSDILSYVSNFLSRVIIVFSLFSLLFAIGGYKINFTPNTNIQPETILQWYLPNNAFKYWFQETKYEKPSRRIKESILRWHILLFVRLFLGQTLGFILLWAFIIRVLFLCFHIDLIPNELKVDLNQTFLKYPQELFAYCFQRFHEKKEEESEQEYLLQKKLSYQSWIPKNAKTFLLRAMICMIPIGIFLLGVNFSDTGFRLFLRITMFSLFYFWWIVFLRYHHHLTGTFPPLPLGNNLFIWEPLQPWNSEQES